MALTTATTQLEGAGVGAVGPVMVLIGVDSPAPFFAVQRVDFARPADGPISWTPPKDLVKLVRRSSVPPRVLGCQAPFT